MKKSFSGMLVTALAVFGVLGMSRTAHAALLIDFDNTVLDGGTITSLGGGNYSGTGIVFDTIQYRDSTGGPGGTNLILGGVQCGAATTTAGATAADACHLDFNTAANTFTVTTGTGLWDAGPDREAFTGDRGGLVLGAGQTVLTGSFSLFQNIGPGPQGNFLFASAGTDSKNPALLAFFGLPANTQFAFGDTEIYAGAGGNVINSDLSNQVISPVPEPATMTLLGLGLVAAARARKRRATE